MYLEDQSYAVDHQAGPLVFPAIITGIAKPQFTTRPWANAPLSDPQPTCADPEGFQGDCSATSTPDADGYYAPEVLPCGVWPVRYRWRAEFLALDSESCGQRVLDGALVPWRQAHYAINTAHLWQDRKLDYDYIRPGTLVIMTCGEIGDLHLPGLEPLVADVPVLGFFFNHQTDAGPGHHIGVVDCVSGGQDPMGCCHYFVGGQSMSICTTQQQCRILNAGTWEEGWYPLDDCVVDQNCFS